MLALFASHNNGLLWAAVHLSDQREQARTSLAHFPNSPTSKEQALHAASLNSRNLAWSHPYPKLELLAKHSYPLVGKTVPVMSRHFFYFILLWIKIHSEARWWRLRTVAQNSGGWGRKIWSFRTEWITQWGFSKKTVTCLQKSKQPLEEERGVDWEVGKSKGISRVWGECNGTHETSWVSLQTL